MRFVERQIKQTSQMGDRNKQANTPILLLADWNEMMAWNGALRSCQLILGQVKGKKEKESKCKSCSIIASSTLVCVAVACICFNWNQIWVQWATPRWGGGGGGKDGSRCRLSRHCHCSLEPVTTTKWVTSHGVGNCTSDAPSLYVVYLKQSSSIKVCAEWVIDCTNTRHLPERHLTT